MTIDERIDEAKRLLESASYIASMTVSSGYGVSVHGGTSLPDDIRENLAEGLRGVLREASVRCCKMAADLLSVAKPDETESAAAVSESDTNIVTVDGVEADAEFTDGISH